jgi:hypothetical protein
MNHECIQDLTRIICAFLQESVDRLGNLGADARNTMMLMIIILNQAWGNTASLGTAAQMIYSSGIKPFLFAYHKMYFLFNFVPQKLLMYNSSYKKTKLSGLSPRANYTDRVTASCH